MSWFRLDDQGAFHAKVVAAGNEAYGAWCRAGQWCSAQLTDGRLPWHIALTLGPRRLWNRLLEVRLCDPVDDTALQLHDFLDWNPSADEVRQRRAELHETKSRAGKAGAAKRWQNRRQTDSSTDGTCHPVCHDSANGRPIANDSPVPIPSRPDPNPPLLQLVRNEPAKRRAKRLSKKPESHGDHAALLATYDEQYQKAKSVKPIIEGRNGKAAKDLLKKVPLAEAQDMVRRAFADDFFRDNQGELWQIANAPNKWRGTAGALIGNASRNNAIPRQPAAKPGEWSWKDNLTPKQREGIGES